MSSAARPHPSTRRSLDVGQVASSSSSIPSTPSLFDNSLHPLEEHSLQSSMSQPIMPPTVNVQFAPLPEIDPRDRRSIHPLGMAARSRMLQQKRDIRMQGVQRHPHGLSDPDRRPMVNEAQEDDPLDDLVRFIADKSKSLWKRVASKAKQSEKDTGVASETTTVDEEQEEQKEFRAPKREGVPSTSDQGISKKISDHLEDGQISTPW